MVRIILTVCLVAAGGGIDYATCEKAIALEKFMTKADCLAEARSDDKSRSAVLVSMAWGESKGHRRAVIRLNCVEMQRDA